MHIRRLTLLLLALGVVFYETAAATTCPTSYFGGMCLSEEIPYICGPTEAGCVPHGGFLFFNSVSPNVPAYWTFQVHRSRVAGRFSGKLKVAAEEAAEMPRVPGFVGHCEDGLCVGRSARVKGTVVGDRFTATARYHGGARCEFRGTIQFGFGGDEPNDFVCRDAAGRIMSSGRFRLQGIRLACCEQ